jgi:hypothetical protein
VACTGSPGDYFEAWLEGYREIRRFGAPDERAVDAFAVIGDLRNIAWQLGVAESSRGRPLLERRRGPCRPPLARPGIARR